MVVMMMLAGCGDYDDDNKNDGGFGGCDAWYIGDGGCEENENSYDCADETINRSIFELCFNYVCNLIHTSP